MKVEPLKLVALALALASIPAPWFTTGGGSVGLLDILVVFMAPFYVGLGAAALSIVKGEERYAALMAGVLLASSPAYAYIAVYEMTGVKPLPAAGALMVVAAGVLYIVSWLKSPAA
ncbi:MAG: hypothetical protein DRK00_06645 [Thermoprotei archaeon]|nr:MAG: hypothetical protein DRK00_06645 [Thermoprotei archaeon]